MTERTGKRDRGGDEGVMGNLPSTRPTRMGRRRNGAARQAEPSAGTAGAPAAPRAGDGATRRPGKERGPTAATRRAASRPTRKATPKPRPVRAGAPSLERHGSGPPRPPQRPPSPPTGAELVTTTVQAVGELAQIGVALSGRAIKRTLDRLPKP